jgi:hypothetical protein
VCNNSAQVKLFIRTDDHQGLNAVEGSRNNGPDPYAATQTIVEELLKDI